MQEWQNEKILSAKRFFFDDFLDSLDTEPEGKYKIFDYAKQFSDDYKDILNARISSARVSKEVIEGRAVELEFTQCQNDKYMWKIVIYDQPRGTQIIGMNILPARNEQYEVISGKDGTYVTQFEMTHQQAVLRRRPIDSPDDINNIQLLIEYMTDTKDFHKLASNIRSDSNRTLIAIEDIKKNSPQNYVERRNLDSLRGHLFRVGFPVGSPSVGQKIPLL